MKKDNDNNALWWQPVSAVLSFLGCLLFWGFVASAIRGCACDQ